MSLAIGKNRGTVATFGCDALNGQDGAKQTGPLFVSPTGEYNRDGRRISDEQVCNVATYRPVRAAVI